ncbi:hypothetical protein EUGRSUZ_K00381 [Eucalyptus grandis]|uniref:Uncharacterized protein n=2 Tax=Eucalyptus grandis TaxID=71139 RepID=A0ACC3IRH4_EUCGR|nr:hypothetical protein EUGRSUZ_K00381 [Eucalyptus grandis]
MIRRFIRHTHNLLRVPANVYFCIAECLSSIYPLKPSNSKARKTHKALSASQLMIHATTIMHQFVDKKGQLKT